MPGYKYTKFRVKRNTVCQRQHVFLLMHHDSQTFLVNWDVSTLQESERPLLPLWEYTVKGIPALTNNLIHSNIIRGNRVV